MKKCLNSYEFEKKLPLLFAGFNGKKCMCRIRKKKVISQTLSFSLLQHIQNPQ